MTSAAECQLDADAQWRTPRTTHQNICLENPRLWVLTMLMQYMSIRKYIQAEAVLPDRFHLGKPATSQSALTEKSQASEG